MSLNNLFLIFIFLFSTLASAGVPQAASVVSLGGAGNTPSVNIPDSAQTKSAGYFTLECGDIVGSITTNNFYPCYKNGVAYSPPNGSTFKAASMCDICAAITCGYQIVQDNGAAITYNQSAALTTGLFTSGANARYTYQTSATANVENCHTVGWQFSGAASNGQMAIQSSNGNSKAVVITGKEVTP